MTQEPQTRLGIGAGVWGIPCASGDPSRNPSRGSLDLSSSWQETSGLPSQMVRFLAASSSIKSHLPLPGPGPTPAKHVRGQQVLLLLCRLWHLLSFRFSVSPNPAFLFLRPSSFSRPGQGLLGLLLGSAQAEGTAPSPGSAASSACPRSLTGPGAGGSAAYSRCFEDAQVAPPGLLLRAYLFPPSFRSSALDLSFSILFLHKLS